MTSLGNKEIMAKNIQRYMRANGLSRKELAQKLNVPYTTITDWIKGNTYPRIDKIEAMANFFGTDKAHLVENPVTYPQAEIEPTPKSARSALPPGTIPVPDLSGLKRIPVLGTSACGSPIEAIREWDYIEVEKATGADFALIAEGKSMTGCGIMDGSMVLFRETSMVDNGQIAAVTVENATTIKRFYRYGDSIVLRACNPDFDDQEYRGDELMMIHVFGRAVACLTGLN